MTIEMFIAKYGSHGWRLAIDEFIARAPQFPGNVKLAEVINQIMADLGAALANSREGG